ncbi:GspH/FimT family pseudopilin [Paucibacter sp. JuS9]|uniref:GspH/FimT family pseudopilin n=1 Tax=Roseateles TaxID=93681 RepID=UPI002FE618FC
MKKLSLLSRGVTLVEMLIVVGILGVILAVAAPSLADMMAKRRVEMVAAELATSLAYARSEAGSRPSSVLVFFGGGGSCYSLVYWGGGGACNCALGAGNACSDPDASGTEIKTVAVPSSTGVTLSYTNAVVTFVSPSMTVTPANPSITVSNRVGQIRVSLNAVGRISSCSPDGSISGYVRC